MFYLHIRKNDCSIHASQADNLTGRPSAMKKEILLIMCIFGIVIANSLSIITNNVFSEMQWTVFTYEFGFIKRGLIGEILRMFFDRPGREVVIVLSYLVMAAALCSLCILYLRPFVQAAPAAKPCLWLFTLLTLSHFATLQFIIFDTGRFDQFGIVCMALSIAAIEKLRGLRTTAAILLLSLIAVLIHEAYFLMFFPLVFFYWMYRDGTKASGFITCAVVAAAVAYIGLFGNLKYTIDRQDYIKHLIATYGPWISEQPVWILYTTTAQHIRVTTQNFTLPVFYRVHAVWLIALLPSLIIFQKMFRLLYATLTAENCKKKHPVLIMLLLLSPFSPLIMYVLGVDFGRWLSSCVINVCIFLSLFLHTNRIYARTCAEMFGRYKKIIILAVVTALILGPLTKSRGFIWNFGYPPAARSCVNAARLYYGDYNASTKEMLDKIRRALRQD
jgi:hypothetical protein